jgi:hypothetical protein
MAPLFDTHLSVWRLHCARGLRWQEVISNACTSETFVSLGAQSQNHPVCTSFSVLPQQQSSISFPAILVGGYIMGHNPFWACIIQNSQYRIPKICVWSEIFEFQSWNGLQIKPVTWASGGWVLMLSTLLYCSEEFWSDSEPLQSWVTDNHEFDGIGFAVVYVYSRDSLRRVVL